MPRLFVQDLGHGARDARAALRRTPALAGLIRVFGAFTRRFLRLAPARRRQVDACASRLREADRNGLLRRACAMLASADLANLLTDELAGLGRGGLAGASRGARPFNRSSLW